MMERFRLLFPYGVLLLLAFILFAPYFLSGRIFLAADTLSVVYPWKQYAAPDFEPNNPLITDPITGVYSDVYNRQLKEGRLTQWNPYILTGVPAVGSASFGNPGRYYPLKIFLNRYLSTPDAQTVLLFIHVFMMGVFMYLYLIKLGTGVKGALFGAVAYMFNGCAMAWLEIEMWVTVSAWLPLLLLAVERFQGERRLVAAFSGGLVLGMMILTGGYQLVLYSGLLMTASLIFAAFQSWRNDKSLNRVSAIAGCFVVACALGLLIGAVEVLPFLELVSETTRIRRTFDFQEFFAAFGRVPFRYFVTLIFPDFFGSPVLGFNLIPKLPTQTYMNYSELCMYAGVPTLFAAAAGILTVRAAAARFYLGVLVVVIAMMTGTIIYFPFFKIVPGMSLMNPTRLIFLFTFAFSIMAAFGIGEMENRTRRGTILLVSIFAFLLLVTVSCSYFAKAPWLVEWFNYEIFPLTADMVGDVQEMKRVRTLSSPVIYRPLFLVSGAFVLFCMFLLVRRRKISFTVFVLMIGLLGYDLIGFSWNYNTTAARSEIYARTPSVDYLSKQAKPFRVVQDTSHDLGSNTLLPFGIEEVGGYSSFIPDRTTRLLSYIEHGEEAFFDRWVKLGDRPNRMLNLLNARYLLTAPRHMITHDHYRLVHTGDLAVYENSDVMPRAYAVHRYTVKKDVDQILRFMGSDEFDMKHEVVLEDEPSAQFVSGTAPVIVESHVVIDAYEPDEIRLSVDLSANGWLVLSDTFYPGWEATVDGTITAIMRADCNFRAVEVPKGRHTILFRYRPASVTYGIRLSILGSLITVAGYVFALRKSSPHE